MPKRKCAFTDELRKSFPAFRPGRDKWEALCTGKAGTYVSVSNGGARDLKIHLDTEKHKTAVRGESSASSITQYFLRPGNEDAVNAAEAAWSFHTVKHHNSYRSMDCTSALLKKTLPDSDTAKKFSCARTKTEAIVDGVLAPHSVEVAHEALKDSGVSTDGSRAGPRHKRPKRLLGAPWWLGGPAIVDSQKSRLAPPRHRA